MTAPEPGVNGLIRSGRAQPPVPDRYALLLHAAEAAGAHRPETVAELLAGREDTDPTAAVAALKASDRVLFGVRRTNLAAGAVGPQGDPGVSSGQHPVSDVIRRSAQQGAPHARWTAEGGA